MFQDKFVFSHLMAFPDKNHFKYFARKKVYGWGSAVQSLLVTAAVNAAYDYACDYLKKHNSM